MSVSLLVVLSLAVFFPLRSVGGHFAGTLKVRKLSLCPGSCPSFLRWVLLLLFFG